MKNQSIDQSSCEHCRIDGKFSYKTFNETITQPREGVQVGRHKPTNTLVVKIPLRGIVPAEFASLGAGRDGWMKDIKIPCQCCKRVVIKCGDDFGIPMLCEDCSETELDNLEG